MLLTCDYACHRFYHCREHQVKELNSIKSERTERRKNKTRKLLMDTAINLLLAQGFDAVTADEIAEGADVGRRTFYNYFDNKIECITCAAKARYEIYAQEQVQRIEYENHSIADNIDSAEIVAQMANALFQSIANDQVTKQLIQFPHILNNAITESQRDFLTANIASGVLTGRFEPILAHEVAQPITSWGFIGLVIASIARKSQLNDGREWARYVLTMLGLTQEQIQCLSFFKDAK